MSEYLQNKEQKQEILKGIIKDLHNGKDPEAVKEDFKNLIKDVDATEIAGMEEELIKEGMPRDEIKKLCDVHALIFKESLERKEEAQMIPGHPAHTLLHENKEANSIIEQTDNIFSEIKNQTDKQVIEKSLNLLKEKVQALKDIEKHYSKKENLFFPYLEKHGITGPPSVMWAVQDDIRAAFKEFSHALTAINAESYAAKSEEINAKYSQLKKMITEMMFKEEKILIPMLLENLSNREWGEIKKQDNAFEFGVIFSKPTEDVWQPEIDDETSTPQTDEYKEQLKLDTGYLTSNQINSILTNLPIDITFVDKDDTVKYFSQGKERIFIRTPAIIGRKVQNCHPPDSVHVVEKILSDFKAGRQNKAEFWLELNGAFVYITYFAIRDESGQYLGTMEVTQNVTNIRKLQGERRLLQYS